MSSWLMLCPLLYNCSPKLWSKEQWQQLLDSLHTTDPVKSFDPSLKWFSQAFFVHTSNTLSNVFNILIFLCICTCSTCQSKVIFWLESEDLSPAPFCLIKLCFCFCESACVVSLNWWPDPVTQIPFHSAQTERKRGRQKRVKVRVREREWVRGWEKGGERGRGRKPGDICSWVDEHRQSLAHSFLSVM